MTLTPIGLAHRSRRGSRARTAYFPFEMGWNIVDPPIELPPGAMLEGVNYEVHYRRGFQRISGYERYDGTGLPSDESYYVVDYTSGSEAFTAGDVIEGATSAASATVLTVVSPTSGSFAGGDAAGVLVLWKVSGTFVAENLNNTTTTTNDVATIAEAPTENGEADDTAHNTYNQAAIEARRDAIAKVPGSGAVRGVWKYKSNYYAFRDNAGGTACVLHKATTSGWSEVDLGEVLYFTGGGEVEIFDDDTIEGASSGATATVKRVVIQSGSVAGDDAAGYMVLLSVTGTFTDGEGIDNTKTVRVPFNSGSEEPTVGDTIVGATSGASGVVKELLPLDSGSWAGGDAAGNLVLTSFNGTSFNGTENLNNTTSGTNNIATNTGAQDQDAAVADGTNEATTLNPGGRYEFVNHNFGGHEESRRMYGADGKNNAFEFDGTAYVPIDTGMETDTPEFISAHKQHLFLAFSGGSLQHSSTGTPLVWSPITGASELAVGENITGLSIEVGNVMAIFARSETYMLYGENSANWDLRRFHQGTGAIKYTVQKMAVTWMLDDQGMIALNATEAYGDFSQAAMTSHIQPYINTVVGPNRKRGPQCSLKSRKKSQYRVYFDDMSGLTLTMDGGNLKGVARFELQHQMNCAYSVKDDEESEGDESEVLLGGGGDGYVYFIDSGTSFDGEEVQAWFLPNYYHYDMPAYNKVFRGLVLDMDVKSTGSLFVIPEYSYGTDRIPTALQATIEMLGSGGRWNVDNWDEFHWSAPLYQQGRVRLDGQGVNMAFLVISESTYEEPHTIQGAIVEYAKRRLVR